MSRYVHAPDDAPLYRVGASLGGKAWPCYRAWNHNGLDCITLDINGALVQFFAEDVLLIARPESLPDWALEMVSKVSAYEDMHHYPQTGVTTTWECFASVLERVPADVLEFVALQKEQP